MFTVMKIAPRPVARWFPIMNRHRELPGLTDPSGVTAATPRASQIVGGDNEMCYRAGARAAHRPVRVMIEDERARRQRLAKVLRLASGLPVFGEQLAALDRAARLVNGLGGWDRVLGVETPAPWCVIVAKLLRQPAVLTPRKRDFLRTVSEYRGARDLSDAEYKWLRQISEPVNTRGAGCAG